MGTDEPPGNLWGREQMDYILLSFSQITGGKDNSFSKDLLAVIAWLALKDAVVQDYISGC